VMLSGWRIGGRGRVRTPQVSTMQSNDTTATTPAHVGSTAELDDFRRGARAMFDALLMRAANNYHPAHQAACDKENRLIESWAKDALEEVSPEDYTEWRAIATAYSAGLGAGSEALRHCPACGDHAAHEVTILECNSCGSEMYSNWKVAPSSPIGELLARYAAECSDFSGQGGYEFALKLARRYAERGPDSQMRCVVHTLLARLEAPNTGDQR